MSETILSIDIGGTGLKASLLDLAGHLGGDKVKMPTPYPCPPEVMVDTLVELVAPLSGFERISIGFPGVVRDGKVITAPHYGTERWAGFPLAATLSERLGRKPARLINDGEMQGLAVIRGKGLEVMMTLGTGVGMGVFREGELMPHLELAHHPVRKGKTYNEYIGNQALDKIGPRRWNKRVRRVIEILDSLIHYNLLYIGGGNGAHLVGPLPDHVEVTSNDAGIAGGAALWRSRVPPGKPAAKQRARGDSRAPGTRRLRTSGSA